MTPEEILKRHVKIFSDYPMLNQALCGYVLASMKEYARQERDKALEWASLNFKLSDDFYDDEVRDSILLGKTHPDLAI